MRYFKNDFYNFQQTRFGVLTFDNIIAPEYQIQIGAYARITDAQVNSNVVEYSYAFCDSLFIFLSQSLSLSFSSLSHFPPPIFLRIKRIDSLDWSESFNEDRMWAVVHTRRRQISASGEFYKTFSVMQSVDVSQKPRRIFSIQHENGFSGNKQCGPYSRKGEHRETNEKNRHRSIWKTGRNGE